jgi:DNA-binding FadR family transcriptional regulator
MSEQMRSVGLAERAAHRIRHEIHKRKLKPGDTIGTEGELATLLGVSRCAIREAVGRLRGLGLVGSRQCKGLVVAQADPAEVMRLVMPSYAVDGASFADLAEMRYCIEMGSVDIAIARQTEEEMAKLVRLGQEHAAADNPALADEIDIEFHKTILSATRNNLLESMHYVISSFFYRSQVEFPEWNLKQATPPQEHALLAAAFAERNVERARQLLSAHLSRYLKIRGTNKPEAVAPEQP